MDVRIEQLGPCKRQLAVTIPYDEIKKKIEDSYVQIRDTVNLPGFRKGHIPRRVMEKRFGEQVAGDVRETLITESYQKALDDNKLAPVGEPDFGTLPEKIEADKPLEFKVVVEVKPEFDIDGYKGMEVTTQKRDATEEEIHHRLDHIRERNADMRTLDAGADEPNDILTCHLSVTADGKEIWNRPQAYTVANAQGIAGIEVAGFAELIKGVKAGDERSADVTLPKDFEEKDWQGKPAKLTIKISEVQRPVLPELNEEWAKKIGFDSLEAVHSAVRRQIEREKAEADHQNMERQIEGQLLKKVDFELPEGLVTRYTENVLRRTRVRLLQQGIPQEQIDGELEKLRPQSAEASIRECKLMFIIDRIGQKEKVFATEEDVQRAVQAMSAQYRMKPMEVAEFLDRQNGFAELRNSIRESKIRALLMENAKLLAAEPAADQPAEAPAASPTDAGGK